MYYLALALLRRWSSCSANLERSRLGRAFVALREDELAGACMGINPARIKLVAFRRRRASRARRRALRDQSHHHRRAEHLDFNYSIMVLCCLIIGGLGSCAAYCSARSCCSASTTCCRRCSLS